MVGGAGGWVAAGVAGTSTIPPARGCRHTTVHSTRCTFRPKRVCQARVMFRLLTVGCSFTSLPPSPARPRSSPGPGHDGGTRLRRPALPRPRAAGHGAAAEGRVPHAGHTGARREQDGLWVCSWHGTIWVPPCDRATTRWHAIKSPLLNPRALHVCNRHSVPPCSPFRWTAASMPRPRRRLLLPAPTCWWRAASCTATPRCEVGMCVCVWCGGGEGGTHAGTPRTAPLQQAPATPSPRNLARRCPLPASVALSALPRACRNMLQLTLRVCLSFTHMHARAVRQRSRFHASGPEPSVSTCVPRPPRAWRRAWRRCAPP